ncbi:MAG: YdbL family protein [Gammaproteobacteria bacterium]|nr:YdbL family protein [Gammaproteobacteria bacterium]
MRRLLPLKLALLTLLIGACVTINVYFPAAAAEKAADQIIDKVKSGATGTAPTAQPPAPAPPTSGLRPTEPALLVAALGRALELLVPAAQAQEANLDVSSPQIRALTASMQARFAELSKYFDSGAVGLGNDGMVEVRDPNAAPLAERATVKRLVAEDNRDRAALYAEIAQANGHPEWEARIRQSFARRWIEHGANPGWYYKDAGGQWRRK